MNVTVENLAPCKKLVRVEVEAQKVDEVLASVTKEFQREANLPGFRPGKAPREMVLWGVQPGSIEMDLELSPEVAKSMDALQERVVEELGKWGVTAVPK